MKTWRVLSWKSRPEGVPDGEPVELCCPHGEGHWALVPTAGPPGSMVIAVMGMSVVFDRPSNVPPTYWLPDEIQCRKCRRIYSRDSATARNHGEADNVR
jgi:hypothetical protein